VAGRRLSRGELPAGPAQGSLRARARHDGLDGIANLGDVLAHPHRRAALEAQAIGHAARPLAGLEPTDEQRIGKLERAHELVLDPRVERALVLGQRRVHGQVAVDGRHALEAMGRVRGHARHHPLEGQRAGLRADDVEARRLGDQAPIEGGVALQRGEGAEPAVLLGADGHEHELLPRPAGGGHGGQRVQGRDDRALHVHAAAAVEHPVGHGARPRSAVAPFRAAGRDDVDVPAHRQPPRPAAGHGDGQPPEFVARRLLAGVVGMPSQRGEIVAMEVGPQAQPAGQLAEALERGALVAGRAGDLDERGGVARQRRRVEGGERLLHGAASSGAGSSETCSPARAIACVSARA
jgi:hypothetical protein